MNHILVVNVNWLGDVVFSTPVFRNLREAYPKAKICCLAVKRVVPLLKCVQDIDEVIELKEGWLHIPGMIAALRVHKFDTAFFLSRSKSRVLLTKLAGIKNRIGYKKNGHARYLTQAIDEADPQSMHRRDMYLNILEAAGVEIPHKETALSVPEGGFTGGEDMIFIHVGANWDLKRWPMESFVHLIDQLDQPVGFMGSQSEVKLVAQIQRRLKKEIISFADKTTIPELLGLLKNAKALVTADSGPMHVASSVGTPVVALFGPTSDVLTGPCGSGKVKILRYDVGCNRGACYHTDCPDNMCMQAITVKDVLDGIEEIQST